LQKAIRRQNLKSAIESAVELYNIDQLVLVRRLAIISLEDVILLEDYPYLLFITAVYPVMKPDLGIMLRMVEALVKSSERDYLPDEDTFVVQNVTLNSLLEIESANLDDLEISLIYSLYLRSSYGGLIHDVDMLIGYGQLWKERFLSTQKDQLKNFLLKTPLELENPIPKHFTKESLILESIDFHIYPQMLKDIGYYIKPNGICEDRLKKIIWYCRSGINTRSNTDDFLKYKTKYQLIFMKIEILVNNYSNLKIKEVFE
jgi:hypothetical protein